jgi:hypothetical protein
MRGRPVFSKIRQNIVELLYYMGKGYGYEVYQAYVDIFPKVTMRSVYYQLRKGVDLGELEIESVKVEKGDYSWGADAEKTYYRLGKDAKPKGEVRIKEYLERRKQASETATGNHTGNPSEKLI